jgi:iron(III) transport system substrate-binding protein
MKIGRQTVRIFPVLLQILSLTLMAGATCSLAATPLERLIEGAKKEGKITVYGSYTYDEGNEIHAAFNKRFPFVKVEQLSVGSGDVTTRILMESKSGTPGADVALVGAPTFLPLAKEGLLRDVDWASLGVHRSVVDTSWGVTCATIIHMLAWNTELVSSANTPKNWKDLLDPKWKGKTGIWVSPTPFADLIPAWGEAQVTDFLKKLLQNDPMIIRTGAEIPSRLAAGEVSVALVIDATVKRIVDKRGPIDWTYPDPLPVHRYDAAIPKLARSPNAATLFSVWLSSVEGATVYEKATGRGNVFMPESPIAQKTKGKQYSFWPTQSEEGRVNAVKQFTKMIAP